MAFMLATARRAATRNSKITILAARIDVTCSKMEQMFRHSLLNLTWIALLAVPAVFGGSITTVDLFANSIDQQTGPTTLGPQSYFFNLGLTSVSPGDYSSVSVTYPGPGSPLNIPQVDASDFNYGSSLYGTYAAMQSDFPNGSYLFTAETAGDTETIAYAGDSFASQTPELTAATFNGLNGMNPNSAFNLAYNGFTVNQSLNGNEYGYSFFTIYNSGGNAVFTFGFESPSFTGGILPAGTLLPGQTYSWELDFSDRYNGTDPATSLPYLIGSDVRTDGSFTTGLATPEPAALGLVGVGLVLLLIRRR
jgi:hypothetical protein